MIIIAKVPVWAIRFLLAAFFLFVGYWKALGPIEALAEHHAWVAGFPNWFARAIGWQEILSAATLLTPAFAATRNIAPLAAIALLVNQIGALAVHIIRGEGAAAGPQNLVLIALLAIAAFATQKIGDRPK